MARGREILFIGAPDEPVTGGEVYDHEVIVGLRADRPVEVITPNGIPPHARGYLASNRWMLGLYRSRFRRLVIVADHFWHPRDFLFLWAARLAGVPVVVIVHHLYHRLRRTAWERWVDRVLEALELHAAHRIVVNSQATADDVASFRVPRSRIVVVHPAAARVPEVAARADRDPAAPLELLAVGYVGDRKGLDYLVDALGDATFPFRLRIVGDPQYDRAYRARLDAMIEERGLAERITFEGRLADDDLDAAYRRADVFVAPALWEGFGMAILEALLHGLPVVASRVGAIPELVTDGAQGILVPSRDPGALRDGLARLATEHGVRLEMGERARDRGLELAQSWDDVRRQVGAVVDELDPPATASG